MRGRGLKQILAKGMLGLREVAPHAGAWIETNCFPVSTIFETVAPHAGAWIETDNRYCPVAK